ncbi:PH domain-containing protein [Nocardioides sp. cx-173]|uniref:PH domain-containing protein n=1 Tax=Nocardioides sp. cx-173 TaxID=2898796 RepID=UPI001E41EFBC|nr:PH domain-containing protein [Nocardioides sp. cx-173]MCD4526108.1 PH domain-containing protein [Nocardioides sp. cx-173]UGB43798.1 PH domain-containing protein [Nocardioides sp. cx-173]
MPAGSEPVQVSVPRTWRPMGPRIAGLVAGAVLVLMMVFLWIGFDDATRESVTPFQRGTVIGLGVLIGVGIHALIRCRAVADQDGLTVVNGYRSRRLAWEQIVGVHLPPGAPWVTLDLADGTTVSVMGIQGSDGQRARTAVRELRWLVDRPDAPRDR